MTLILIHFAITAYAFWETWNAMQQLRLNVIKAIVFGAIGLIYGLVPAVGPPWYDRTPDPYQVHMSAAGFVLAGTLLLGLGWRLFQQMSPSRIEIPSFEFIQHPSMQQKIKRLMIICAVGGFLAWLGTVYASGATLMTMLTSRRLEFRGEGSGPIGMLAGNLMFMTYVPGFLAPFVKGKFRIAGFAYAIIFVIGLFLLSKGTRAGAIGMCGSMISGMMLSRRISAERLVASITAISLMGILAIGMLPLRHRMSTMSYSEMASFLISSDAYQNAMTRDPLNYHNHFVAVVGVFPSQYAYVDGATYKRIIFFYLPGERFRALKPLDPNRIVAQALFGSLADEVDWMHPPGIFGDCYINFWGWASLPWLMLEGFFLAWVTRRIVVSPWWLLAIGPQLVFLCLIGIRGQPYTVAISMLFSLIGIAFLMKVSGIPLQIQIVGYRNTSHTSHVSLQAVA